MNGVSIWGQMASTTGTSGGSYTKMTQSAAYTTTGTLADVVIHGLTWLRESVMAIAPLSNSGAGGAAQFEGGVVASQLTLNIVGQTNISATIAGSSTTVTAPRTVTITSVATPVGGGAPTTVKVVAVYPTTAGGYPTIQSWRKL